MFLSIWNSKLQQKSHSLVKDKVEIAKKYIVQEYNAVFVLKFYT